MNNFLKFRLSGILERFPRHWDTMYQSSMLEPPQKQILTGLQVLEMIRNGTILKIPLQIIRSRRNEATEEEIDQYKVATIDSKWGPYHSGSVCCI